MKQTRIFALFLLMFFMAATVGAAERKTGYLSGRLMIKNGAPLAGGLAFLFNPAAGPPPSPEKYWRVPDEIVPIDKDGRFKAELLEGKYYLGAIKRISGKEIGPPQEGDFFLISRDTSGEPKAYLVNTGGETDVGTIAEAAPFKRAMLKMKEGITAIEGTVVDPTGKPIDGALVFAFLTPSMVGKPIFVSERTDKDGKFLLRVFGSDHYYLKTRDIYGGGPPKVGAVIGSYGEDTPIAVNVKAGEIKKGIEIKVVRFSGQGPKQK